MPERLMAHSKLVKMKILNLGCIGNEGLEIALDSVVCLVGANNSGKSTVLRAYELATTNRSLTGDDVCRSSNGEPPSVELWIHIPPGTMNIAAQWVEEVDGLRLVRSRWTWGPSGKPTRETWNPSTGQYAADGNAAGLDQVFSARLPQPLRIGSLEDPTTEHKVFLSLIVEPVAADVEARLAEEGSELAELLDTFTQQARKPITDANNRFDKIRADVDEKFRDVFPSLTVHLKMDLTPPSFNAKKSILEASEFFLKEFGEESRWTQHGTGAQRALFWSMLQVRSRLTAQHDAKKRSKQLHATSVKKLESKIKKIKRAHKTAKTPSTKAAKKTEYEGLEQELADLRTAGPQEVAGGDDLGLPGHMLLIDEPETALHPSAVRAAARHLYELAEDAGWQVMMATHAPTFIDPLSDHTTIVRLQRNKQTPSPQVFRADSVTFDDEEAANLKSLLRFDTDLAEMFFGGRPILVEGDTEYAAFQEVMNMDPTTWPFADRPVLVRARGKDLMVPIIRMLAHFKVPFSILHDSDVFRTKSDTRSSAWSANERLYVELLAAQVAGVPVRHGISVPNFEGSNGRDWESSSGKPWGFVAELRQSSQLRDKVVSLLSELNSNATEELQGKDEFMASLTDKVKKWGSENVPENSKFEPVP
jgi:putative ATP-dependent endonuclease of the OLD family